MGIDLSAVRLSPAAAALAAWLLTYAVHAALFAVLVALGTRVLRAGSDALRETLWKCALAGAVGTASVQLAAGGGPIGPAWRLASSPVPLRLPSPSPCSSL
ncbi:MAG: hypothetical protein AB1726_05395, partial [Planctomycetota bacterium]